MQTGFRREREAPIVTPDCPKVRPAVTARQAFLLAAASLALAGCAPPADLPPQLAAAAASNAPNPALAPLETLLAQGAAPVRVTPETGRRLDGAAAALRARAAALRGAVVDPATRARMAAGVGG